CVILVASFSECRVALCYRVLQRDRISSCFKKLGHGLLVVLHEQLPPLVRRGALLLGVLTLEEDHRGLLVSGSVCGDPLLLLLRLLDPSLVLLALGADRLLDVSVKPANAVRHEPVRHELAALNARGDELSQALRLHAIEGDLPLLPSWSGVRLALGLLCDSRWPVLDQQKVGYT